MGINMEGVPMLISDSSEGLCFTILESLSEKKALPFVLVKDFETVYETSENFEQAIPIVLNVHQNVESTIDHLAALPSISCIFNFDGEYFENLLRQTLDSYKTINIYKVDFDIDQVHTDMLEAIAEGYTLILNLIPLPLTGTTLLSTSDGGLLSTSTAHEHLVVLETLFLRKSQSYESQLPSPPRRAKSSKSKKVLNKYQNQNNQIVKCSTGSGSSRTNPLRVILKKWFSRFNPCAVTPVLDLIPKSRPGVCPVMGANVVMGVGIKSPQEINKYIRTYQAAEIRQSFQVIHESANRNWKKLCENNFQFTVEHQQTFERICEEIHRKGEEGRRSLMNKTKKDIERTRHYDHVLGDKAIAKIKLEKEKDIDLKVKQFCQRKMLETKVKIDEEIRLSKIRAKGRFHGEILEEQVMELMRIKEKYQKRKELLMLPYTGELTLLRKT